MANDADLEQVLQLADSIRAHPVYDDTVDIDLEFLNTQSTFSFDLAHVIEHTEASEEVSRRNDGATGSRMFQDVLLDDGFMLTLLNELLPTNEIELQRTSLVLSAPNELLDSYIMSHETMLKKFGIIQPLLCRWPSTYTKSSSYWSFTEEPGSATDDWSLKSAQSSLVSPSPSPSSSSASSSSSSWSEYSSNFNWDDVGRTTFHKVNGSTLPAQLATLRRHKNRNHKKRSDTGGSRCSSSSVNSSRRTRQPGKTNKMKVHHLWEFIRELLDISEIQQQLQASDGRDDAAAAAELVPVQWESKENGVFRIVDSKRMAKLWGAHKSNPTMTYEKLSRSLRWCRSSGYLSEVPKHANYPKKLCFRFGHRAGDLHVASRWEC